MNEPEALTVLMSTPGLGRVKVLRLLKTFGSAKGALERKKEEIQTIKGISSVTLENWQWWKTNLSWEKNIEIAYNQNVKIITTDSPEYPPALLELPDYPLLLYVKGHLQTTDTKSLAVVGTRNPTLYGKDFAEKLSFELASFGLTIVSGLARGVDTAAHKGALKSGRTLAVIGSGLANIYPKENKELSRRIEENGALISEFSMLTPPEKQNFPKRNRIVSGMTLGTVLIEAPEKSGAMITMRQALEQKRKLFALPGRVDNPNFKGNHLLIKKGLASLVENKEDIMVALNDKIPYQSFQKERKEIPPFLSEEEKHLLHRIPEEELNIEEIVKITKLPVMKLNILLMSLVMKKVIREYPGKIYKKG